MTPTLFCGGVVSSAMEGDRKVTVTVPQGRYRHSTLGVRGEGGGFCLETSGSRVSTCGDRGDSGTNGSSVSEAGNKVCARIQSRSESETWLKCRGEEGNQGAPQMPGQ